MVPPAQLLSKKTHLIPGKFPSPLRTSTDSSSKTNRQGQLLVSELFFEVPVDYADPAWGTLQLFGRSVCKFEKPIVPLSNSDQQQASQKPWFVFLEGGPGFGNREPQESPLTRVALSRGYQLLFLDYRGTGLSTPVTADTVKLKNEDPLIQADYLKHFRQDNIVRDSEAVRKSLTDGYPPEKKTWSIFGQSFGGWVSLTYLSLFPQGLREVFLTGGLAPIGKTADQVYEATYKKVIERNEAYYDKFPEDVATINQIGQYIQSNEGKIPLPAGGFLTLPRLMTMGLSFGGHGGLDIVHGVLLKMRTDLDAFGFLTRTSLTAVEQFVPFDCNVIYAILHEAIYCCHPGVASNWAAYRIGKDLEQFSWLSKPPLSESGLAATAPLYFTGEMIFPFHFETYPELTQLRRAAQLLAECDSWPKLYDEDQLAKNQVPVYAVSFIDDMYVDFEFSRETAAKIRGIKMYETNSMYHNAIRARTDEVLRELFRLRDDSID
jgi:pimeloyl-ACP methyl ester carboxylesterase